MDRYLPIGTLAGPEQSELVRKLQLDSFGYSVHRINPANGLVRDKSWEGWPASIAAFAWLSG